MDLVVTRSTDGRTWSPFEVVTPPLVGPAFEVCHRIVALPDGEWVAHWESGPSTEEDVRRHVPKPL